MQHRVRPVCHAEYVGTRNTPTGWAALKNTYHVVEKVFRWVESRLHITWTEYDMNFSAPSHGLP